MIFQSQFYIRVLFALTSITTLMSTQFAFGTESSLQGKSCLELLQVPGGVEKYDVLVELNKIDPNQVEPEHRVRTKTYSIFDFASSDPKLNLAARVPSSVMNSAEYIRALILHHGVRKVLTPYSREEIRIYSALSDGIPEVRGRRAVGQWKALEDGIMTSLDNQADGMRAGVYPTLYKGPPGTGKSEISVVIPGLMEHWTKNADQIFGMLTGVWKNLDEITEPSFVGKYQNTWPFPTDASPVAVLPEQLQKHAIKMGSDEVTKIIGRPPRPKFALDSQSKEIRSAILTHYEKKKGSPLTMSEIMAALNHHMDVIHVVVDSSYQTIIDSQGQDIDTGTLFGMPNAMNRVINGQPTAPSSWFLASVFGRANRKYLAFDESFTNSNELLKMFLRVIESRRYGISGPSEEIDSFFVAFTNDVDYEKKIKEGHGALANRHRPVQLRGAVFPRLIEDLLYYSVAENLVQTKIAKSDNEEEVRAPYNHKEVVPVPENQNVNQVFPGPEYRYRLEFGYDQSAVYIAPHVGRFVADLVAATRFITDAKRANDSKPGTDVTSLNEFHDELARLRAYHGESDLNIEAYFDLVEMGELLGEGSSFHPGILSRNALKWWSSILTEAKKSVNKNTVTPSLVLEVFYKQMNSDDKKGGIFEVASNTQRLAWMNLMERLRSEWLIKTLRSDVLEAYGHGNHTAHRAFFEILSEFKALEAIPGAITVADRKLQLNVDRVEYTLEGKKMVLDKERFQKVALIYRGKTGRMLNPMQIGKLIGMSTNLTRTDEVSEELSRNELYASVVEYYADLAVQGGQLGQMVHQLTAKPANSSDALRLEAENFLQNMWQKGYNEYSAVIAAKMVNEELKNITPAKPAAQ